MPWCSNLDWVSISSGGVLITWWEESWAWQRWHCQGEEGAGGEGCQGEVGEESGLEGLQRPRHPGSWHRIDDLDQTMLVLTLIIDHK